MTTKTKQEKPRQVRWLAIDDAGVFLQKGEEFVFVTFYPNGPPSRGPLPGVMVTAEQARLLARLLNAHADVLEKLTAEDTQSPEVAK